MKTQEFVEKTLTVASNDPVRALRGVRTVVVDLCKAGNHVLAMELVDGLLDVVDKRVKLARGLFSLRAEVVQHEQYMRAHPVRAALGPVRRKVTTPVARVKEVVETEEGYWDAVMCDEPGVRLKPEQTMLGRRAKKVFYVEDDTMTADPSELPYRVQKSVAARQKTIDMLGQRAQEEERLIQEIGMDEYVLREQKRWARLQTNTSVHSN
jgi:hypothetical protein